MKKLRSLIAAFSNSQYQRPTLVILGLVVVVTFLSIMKNDRGNPEQESQLDKHSNQQMNNANSALGMITNTNSNSNSNSNQQELLTQLPLIKNIPAIKDLVLSFQVLADLKHLKLEQILEKLSTRFPDSSLLPKEGEENIFEIIEIAPLNWDELTNLLQEDNNPNWSQEQMRVFQQLALKLVSENPELLGGMPQMVQGDILFPEQQGPIVSIPIEFSLDGYKLAGRKIVELNTKNGLARIRDSSVTLRSYAECNNPELANANWDQSRLHKLIQDYHAYPIISISEPEKTYLPSGGRIGRKTLTVDFKMEIAKGSIRDFAALVDVCHFKILKSYKTYEDEEKPFGRR